MNTETVKTDRVLIDAIQECNNANGQISDFDEMARICRAENRILDEIKVLKIAVSFYKNPDLDDEQRSIRLSRYKARLKARQKEAKVLEILNW